jgi:hypothetical protein
VNDAADHRRENRRQRLRCAHRGQYACAARRLVAVAHDRARDDLPAARADGLHDARGDQRRHRRGQRACRARQRVQRQAGEKHRATAEPIGERPPDELRAGESRKEERHGELRGGGMRVEEVGDRRQRGQEHVDRKRAKPDDSGQEDDERRRAVSGHRAGLSTAGHCIVEARR